MVGAVDFLRPQKLLSALLKSNTIWHFGSSDGDVAHANSVEKHLDIYLGIVIPRTKDDFLNWRNRSAVRIVDNDIWNYDAPHNTEMNLERVA
jgi:hypothetical protein